MDSADCEVGTGEKVDLEPRRHMYMMADLSIEKFIACISASVSFCCMVFTNIVALTQIETRARY